MVNFESSASRATSHASLARRRTKVWAQPPWRYRREDPATQRRARRLRSRGSRGGNLLSVGVEPVVGVDHSHDLTLSWEAG